MHAATIAKRVANYLGVSITAEVVFESATSQAASYTIKDAPDGFLINPKTGLIQGTPTTVGDYTMGLYVIGANSMEEAKLEDIVIKTRFDDTTQARYGPNSRSCFADGVPVDNVKFNQQFTCNCAQTRFTGENCDKLLAIQDSFRSQLDSNYTTRLGWKNIFYINET